MWIVAVKRDFYPEVHAFVTEEEARAKYDEKLTSTFGGIADMVFLTEVVDYGVVEAGHPSKSP